MKWYLDTHKYISEVTRMALQVLVKYQLNSESPREDIEKAENELGDIGVYKSRENARGRIRRALFTYFKAYDCMDDNEQLTELGKLYVENKLSIKEFSFLFILNYYYKTAEEEYYPAHLILQTLAKLRERDESEAYISANDFERITEAHSIEDISEEFIDNLMSLRKKNPEAVNERGIGYDVWSKMLIQADILYKVDKNLFVKNWELLSWILDAYSKQPQAKRGEIYTGIMTQLPILRLSNPHGKLEKVETDNKAVQAFLFDAIDGNIIEKYISNNLFSDISTILGLHEGLKGYYARFNGLERLVGVCLSKDEHPAIKVIGELLIDTDLSECELTAVNYYTHINVDYDKNRIVFGAPGTGKSWSLEKDRKDALKDGAIGGYERVTFHPDYTYSQFVGTYKPVTDDLGNINYKFVPGPFMRLYVEALKNGMTDHPEPFILIIEEINRANVAAVFGDIFQLLDRDALDVSEYPIQTTEDIRNYLATQLGGSAYDYEEIRIPNNMLIWATMNSADQGVFPMDTAFKRRWDFTYLGIDNGEDKIAGKTVVLGKGEHKRKVEWNALRKEINQVLLNDCKVNEDKLMGSFFIGMKNLPEGNEIDVESFTRIFKNKVIMYLFDDAAKQKRTTLFDGCDVKNLYSAICEEFDEKGVDIFSESVRSAFPVSADGDEK